jgi:hypothetical protein
MEGKLMVSDNNGNLRELVLAWRETDRLALNLSTEANKIQMAALNDKYSSIAKLVYIGLGIVLTLNVVAGLIALLMTRK